MKLLKYSCLEAFFFFFKTSLRQFFMSSCQETTSPLFTNEVLTVSVKCMRQCCCDVMLMAVLCPVQMRHTSSWLGRLWRNLTGVWTSWRPFRPTALLARWLPTRCFFNHLLLLLCCLVWLTLSSYLLKDQFCLHTVYHKFVAYHTRYFLFISSIHS